MKYLLSIILCFLFFCAVAQKKYFMLVGTYTTGASNGVYIYEFNNANGDSRLIDSIKTSNPSYLSISPNEKYIYTVNEDADAIGTGGRISSFSFNKKTGSVTPINQQPSNGNHPCYITVDKTGRWVIAGNYSSGTVAVLPVFKNGVLDTAVTTIQHFGQSVNTDRQNDPHVHATVLSPDEKYLFVPDLGIDKVMAYHFNKKNGSLTTATPESVMVKPGSGPRHFVFHPNKKFAYLLEELTGSISAYQYITKEGKLNLVQNISALPPDYMGSAGSADIHVSPDGNFLYSSNRGESNTIAIFSINKKTGQLTFVAHQSTLGKTPRNFNFNPTGNFLLVANQNSNDIVVFKIDKQTGLLTNTGKKISVSKPVCIKWIAKN